MSDEITFLRWYHRNADRFDSASGSYRHTMAEAYEAETGNRVPNDYRVAA